MADLPMQLPYGAVYFRKSNPPRADWDRDYGVAGEDGLNIFRHWFMWASIEREPGKYDWADYDRQMDLAAKNNIKTVIAELTHTVPDWAMHEFADARTIHADGTIASANMGVSSATGGFSSGAGALTLNAPKVREQAGKFLTALATRYKDHPAMLGYDVWNEVNYGADVDYSEHSKRAFRDWLKAKYGTLDALADAWYRYSYFKCDYVEPPTEIGPYPQSLDWLMFKRENFYGLMQWRIDTIRKVDAKNRIIAHGVSGAIPNLAAHGSDDWLAASKVEVYGMTWIAARKGDQPWRNWYGVDLTRAASRGKPFWHAERQGGPLWLQPQVLGRDKDDGRVPTPEDIRLWSLTSLAGGARGILNLRWRPLLDGPLFGAFGSYAMDGSRTPRSDMASKMAKWGNTPDTKALMQSKPVRGEIGIVVAPELQMFDYALNHESKFDTYAAAMWGAYRGFFDNGIQADWVHIDDIDTYDTLYFAYPIMLTEDQAQRLAAWVKNGGTLVSEACPAYFGDRGHVGVVQPNYGLDKVFGVREDEVEFMPDIGDRIHLKLDGKPVDGGGYLQSYTLVGGKAHGDFEDGRLAVVSHTHGKGKTLLVGTHPSVAYYRKSSDANRRYFQDIFAWTGKAQHVSLSNPALQARIHKSDTGSFLWLVNPTRQPQKTSFTLAADHKGKPVASLWPEKADAPTGDSITVPARDALILQLG
ncbi:MAG TPA: beta-galactosidase [Devosiaceae bacterium]|jgi:beta-galactosidase